MLKLETTSRAIYAGAAALFCAAVLATPFAAQAQDAPSQLAPSTASAAAPSADSATSIILTDGAQSPRHLITQSATVGDALRDAGIIWSHDDRIYPAPATPVAAQMQITITRVRFVTQTVAQSIPFHTVFQMSRDVPAGRIRAGHTGVPGVRTLTYCLSYINDVQTSRRLVSSVVTRQPVEQQTLGGIRIQMARALPSRGGAYNRMRALMMTATGYSPYEGSGSGRCATGMRAGYGVVAVDPRVIHLGTRLYIQGYGYAVAGDTGGAIKGHRIDLGSATYSEACQVGRRRVKVWVLAPQR